MTPSTRVLTVVLIFFITAPLQISSTNFQKTSATSALKHYIRSGKQFFDLLNATQLVTKKENSVITIDQENHFSILEPCKIPDEESRELIGTATVKDKLILLLAHQYWRDDEVLPLKTTEYSLVIVNPWICEPKFIEVEKQDIVPVDKWPHDIGFLMANEDSFDLFSSNQKTCGPCRYSPEGERIQLPYSIKPVPGGHAGYRLVFIEYGYPPSGYEYYYWKRDDNSEVKHELNQEFQVVK